MNARLAQRLARDPEDVLGFLAEGLPLDRKSRAEIVVWYSFWTRRSASPALARRQRGHAPALARQGRRNACARWSAGARPARRGSTSGTRPKPSRRHQRDRPACLARSPRVAGRAPGRPAAPPPRAPSTLTLRRRVPSR